MTGKEYLNEIRSIEMRLRMLESEVHKLEQDIRSLTALDYSVDVVQTSDTHDLSDKVAKLVDMRDSVNREWDKLINLRQEARGYIKRIGNYNYQFVLVERYINAKTWERIAADMNCTWQNLHKIHKRALIAFEKIKKGC